MDKVVGLVNKLQQICTQLGDTAGNSILVDKLSSIVVVGGQVRAILAVPGLHAAASRPKWHNLQQLGLKQGWCMGSAEFRQILGAGGSGGA